MNKSIIIFKFLNELSKVNGIKIVQYAYTHTSIY